MDLVEVVGARAVRHPWETARLHVIERLISRYAAPPPGSAIVDIGCGDAFIALSLADRYPSCAVIGIDSEFTDAALARLNGSRPRQDVVFFRSLDDAPKAEPAALVLLMDVLEHVDNDRTLLREVAFGGLLSASTRVLVTVPAYQWLWSGHDVFLRHHRRYSRRALAARLTDAGLRVEQSGYFFSSLIPVRLLKVLKESLVGRPEGGSSDLMTESGGRLGAAVLSRLLVADACIGLALGRVGCMLPGLSAYAICRKSA
jgi:hypothetical protein